MFDISKAQSIAKTAGNSHGADMLKDACNEIERLLAERDAAIAERDSLITALECYADDVPWTDYDLDGNLNASGKHKARDALAALPSRGGKVET